MQDKKSHIVNHVVNQNTESTQKGSRRGELKGLNLYILCIMVAPGILTFCFNMSLIFLLHIGTNLLGRMLPE